MPVLVLLQNALYDILMFNYCGNCWPNPCLSVICNCFVRLCVHM